MFQVPEMKKGKNEKLPFDDGDNDDDAGDDDDGLMMMMIATLHQGRQEETNWGCTGIVAQHPSSSSWR